MSNHCVGTSAWTDLVNRFDRTSISVQPTKPANLPSKPLSFRTSPFHSKSIESDWSDFYNPSFFSPSSFGSRHDHNTLDSWLETFQEAVVRDDESPIFSPELQTVIETNRSIASSPALSASSYVSELPTPDEVERVICSCSHNLAHPLTCQPCQAAAWDFDRLFSRRRRWFGGSRIDSKLVPPTEDDLPPLPSSPKGRSRSRSRSRSRLCQEILSSPEISPEAPPTEDVHEKLRQSAMIRLSSVMRHVGWEVGSNARFSASKSSSS